MRFVFNIIYGREDVDFMFCLAAKYHGYSIYAQSYEFCPHLAELDNLDFTLYHTKSTVYTVSTAVNTGRMQTLLNYSLLFIGRA